MTVVTERPATAGGEPLTAAPPDPSVVPGPVVRGPGAQALDEARAFYRKHFHWASTVQLDAFTIWCAGLTHMRDHNHRYIGRTAARCYVRASTSNAGKSLLGKFVERTGGRGEMVFAPVTTQWGLVRMVAEENLTVILDNYDESKGQAKQGQTNIALAGAYDDTALLRSGKKDDPEAYVYGPLMITAIGDVLRRSSSFKPVEERSIVIDVARAPKDAKHVKFDRWDPEHVARAEAIRRACEAWGRDVAPDVLTYRPTDLPVDEMDDRAVDMWEPLVAIADFAGGAWPARIRRALRVLVLAEAVEADEDDDPFARLTPAQRTMVEVAHVLRQVQGDAELVAVASDEEAPRTAPITTVALLERMAELPAGRRWELPTGKDRDRVMRMRTMALAADLAMFGVVRSSVKVPAADGTGRHVNGWWTGDVLPLVPSDLPTFRPSDLETHARQREDDVVPFE